MLLIEYSVADKLEMLVCGVSNRFILSIVVGY